MTRTWLTFLTKTFQVFQWSSTQWISELQWGVTIATAALPSLPYHRFPLTLPLSNASHDIPTGTKTKIADILCEYLVARWTQAMSSDRSHTVCPTCKYVMWQACIFPDQRIGTHWPAATAWYRPIQLVHALYTGTGHCNRHWQYTGTLVHWHAEERPRDPIGGNQQVASLHSFNGNHSSWRYELKFLKN